MVGFGAGSGEGREVGHALLVAELRPGRPAVDDEADRRDDRDEGEREDDDDLASTRVATVVGSSRGRRLAAKRTHHRRISTWLVEDVHRSNAWATSGVIIVNEVETRTHHVPDPADAERRP
jgi:hypothetical protein